LFTPTSPGKFPRFAEPARAYLLNRKACLDVPKPYLNLLGTVSATIGQNDPLPYPYHASAVPVPDLARPPAHPRASVAKTSRSPSPVGNGLRMKVAFT